MRFKINWASRIVGSKLTIFALFYFVFEGNFSSTSARGAYIWTGLGGVYLEGLIHGGAYFRNFTVHYFQHFIFRYQILRKIFLTKFIGPLIFSTCAEIKCGNEVCKFNFQVLYSCYLLLFHYIYMWVGYIEALEQQFCHFRLQLLPKQLSKHINLSSGLSQLPSLFLVIACTIDISSVDIANIFLIWSML